MPHSQVKLQLKLIHLAPLESEPSVLLKQPCPLSLFPWSLVLGQVKQWSSGRRKPAAAGGDARLPAAPGDGIRVRPLVGVACWETAWMFAPGALHGVVEIRETPLRSVGEGEVKYIHQQQILLLVTVQMNKLYKKLSNFVCFHPVRHHQANFVSFLLASRVLLNWNSESHLDGKPVLWGGSFQWKACEPGLRQLTVCGLLFRRLALVAHADLDWLPQSAHMLFCKTMVSESVPLVNFGAKSKISRASTVGTYSCNHQLDSKAFNSNKLKKIK